MQTCHPIIKVLKEHNQIPQNEEGWVQVAKQYERKCNFPHCLGAMDCKHVLIRKPAGSGSYYFNYKHTFSIVLMVIVNADYQFLMIDVGANGRVSDGGVFANTIFYKKLSQNRLLLPKEDNLPLSRINAPYVFVADDAFPLMKNIIKPFSMRNLSKEETIYNYRISRARRVVENVFRIITPRFRVFQTQINLEPEKASIVVMACCYLDNFLRSKNVESYLQGGLDAENENSKLSLLLRAGTKKKEI
ncbi:uncharacterized protein LOC119656083 [Hermetia illucens]|uniref:uncharacterized protein LOC119656083 n=1 Tax=Hermetia illucens TaxID=343691 RepID=UPI0018CC7484|nr:uncharacterized protein LOC119656083 [Hermetia illucens]